MEFLLFVGLVVAAYFAYGAGVKEGEERTLSKIAHAAHTGMAPDSAFASTYGRAGFYFHDLHPNLKSGPLAVLSSHEFLRLVAKERIGNDAKSQDLADESEKLSDAYHIANGGTVEDLKALKMLFGGLRPNEDET